MSRDEKTTARKAGHKHARAAYRRERLDERLAALDQSNLLLAKIAATVTMSAIVFKIFEMRGGKP